MFKRNLLPAGIFLGIVCSVLVAVFIIHLKSAPKQYHLEAFNFDNQKSLLQQFEKEIRTFGDKRAYDRLANAVSGLSADDQHEYGHLFGDALYSVEGLKGIAVCDTRFSYGCFHQILSDALLKYGSSAVPMLDQRCKEVLKDAYLSCQHGLGHGIMVSVGLNRKGYDEPHLIQALDECRKLPDDHPRGGCDGGVYMEYNLRTAANVELDQNNIRPADKGDYYYPCDHLKANQQATCYFWMPQWWALAGAIRYAENQNISDDLLYRKTGDLCGSLSPESSRACFEGIGYAVISTAKLDPKVTLHLCMQASSNAENSLYCRSFAASMLKDVTQNSAAANYMCQGLTGSRETFCMAYAKEKGNFFTSLPAPGSELPAHSG
ncbi:MAG TPA: hypothetical protein VFJ84_01300 [Candidatus Saccharimonadales bacterium]|nr:hypothetical protein [Candidatus Saccharimonadales bacterium]